MSVTSFYSKRKSESRSTVFFPYRDHVATAPYSDLMTSVAGSCNWASAYSLKKPAGISNFDGQHFIAHTRRNSNLQRRNTISHTMLNRIFDQRMNQKSRN